MNDYYRMDYVYGRPGYVWVSPHSLANGVKISGHWRMKTRAGFVWIAGTNAAAGYWKPVGKTSVGKVWVAGHVNEQKGFVWIPGHTKENGRYVEGHWKKK